MTSLEQVESVKQEFDYFFESIWNQANYSKDEKYYMAAYAAWCGNSLNEKCIKDKYLKYLAFDNYNLKNVRNALKMNFPLRVDPRFKK